MTNQPTPTTDSIRVVLQFERTVERECGECEGGGYYPPTLTVGGGPCVRCQGTGKVRVRVSGEIDPHLSVDADGEVEWEVVSDDGTFYNYRQGFTSIELACKSAVDVIVAAYLAGTLPAEIAAHIKEEPVDDTDSQ